MESIIEVLKKTPEYQSFGMNALTMSAIGATVFTFLQGWGLWKQGRSIWDKRSGKSISVIFIAYSMFYFLAFCFYGAQRSSITMTFNGLLFLIHIPIMLGLLEFKGFTRFEWALICIFAVGMPTGIFVLQRDAREIFLMILLFGILATLVRQTYEVYKAKVPGALEPKYLYVFLFTNVFWFTYAFTIGNWPLMVFNPCAFVLLGVNLVLYYRYKRRMQEVHFIPFVKNPPR